MPRPRRLHVLAALALAAFLIHNANHAYRGEAFDALWVCNVAPALLAVGCAARRAAPVAVATLWLLYGTPMWLLDLATGASLIVTSVLPHLLCPVVGVIALRELGVPGFAWARASASLVALMIVTRLVTPAAANVNMVFAVWHGWEHVFPGHLAYLAFGLTTSGLTFFVAERLLRRLVRRSDA